MLTHCSYIIPVAEIRLTGIAVQLVTIELKSQLSWNARQSTSSERWIAVCDAMNLAVEADSLDELRSVINETIHLTLIDLLEDNELDRFLQERGWAAKNLPLSAKNHDVEFDVPWQLIAEGAMARDSARRAH